MDNPGKNYSGEKMTEEKKEEEEESEKKEVAKVVLNEEIWKELLAILEKNLDKQVFEMWFKPARFLRGQENILEIGLPSKFFEDRIRERYLSIMQETLRNMVNQEVEIKFVIPQPAEREKNQQEKKEQEEEKIIYDEDYLTPKYTFENFVVGNNNQFARAASMAVAETPGEAYNPLFIYGSVGLGKTHLLHAIGHFIKQRKPQMKPKYLSSEKFTNDLVNSIRDDRMEEFRQHYRNIEVLLLDDIQFFIGKERTQEEFFHTFNNLYDSRCQIVISSDRPPQEMSGLEERLRSRFEWGLIVDIQRPDLETRVAILKQKMQIEKVEVSNEVLNFIASKITDNVRELEGALTKIIAYSSLMNKEMDLATSREVLKSFLPKKEGEKEISIELIQKKVAEYYRIRYEDIKIKRRTREVVFPRQIAMYLSRELTDYSFPEIAREFNKKDHTTVIHAHNKIGEKIEKDFDFSEEIKKIIEGIKH